MGHYFEYLILADSEPQGDILSHCSWHLGIPLKLPKVSYCIFNQKSFLKLRVFCWVIKQTKTILKTNFLKVFDIMGHWRALLSPVDVMLHTGLGWAVKSNSTLNIVEKNHCCWPRLKFQVCCSVVGCGSLCFLSWQLQFCHSKLSPPNNKL